MDKGGVNSGPDGYEVPDGVQTDRPGFSYATPLKSLGPIFQDERGDRVNERRSRINQTGDGGGGYSEERG